MTPKDKSDQTEKNLGTGAWLLPLRASHSWAVFNEPVKKLQEIQLAFNANPNSPWWFHQTLGAFSNCLSLDLYCNSTVIGVKYSIATVIEHCQYNWKPLKIFESFL